MGTKVDLLIKNGTVVTMDSEKTVIDSGYVAVKDGEIVGIGKIESLGEKFTAKETIDAENRIVMPGLVNTHTHAAMTLFRGLADDLPLNEWLENYIWPAEKKLINPDNIRKGTLLAAVEMIRSGTTTFNDMYFYWDEVAKACKEVGIRVMIGEVFFNFPGPNNLSGDENLGHIEEQIKKWKGDSLVSVAMNPHAPYSCSKELLEKSKKLADKYDVPIHIHISESEKEVSDMKEKNGMTPVEYLDSLGFLDHKVIAPHCVHLSKDDIKLLAKRKVGVAHCPESNMKLASGVAPVADLLKTGVKVGLGTDGVASNNNLDMFKSMDFASKLHKVFTGDPTVLDAEAVVEMATIGGAKVLGLDEKIGSLEKGKRADLIIVDLEKPHLTPMYNVYSHLVYAAAGADVETVVVDGKLVMKDYKILTVDEKKIMDDVKKISEEIREGWVEK